MADYKPEEYTLTHEDMVEMGFYCDPSMKRMYGEIHSWYMHDKLKYNFQVLCLKDAEGIRKYHPKDVIWRVIHMAKYTQVEVMRNKFNHFYDIEY